MTADPGGRSDRQAATRSRGWSRWLGRPGRSLTRRLIWLASIWIVLALLWPDVTIRVLAFILGLQIALFGLLLVASAFIGPRAREGV